MREQVDLSFHKIMNTPRDRDLLGVNAGPAWFNDGGQLAATPADGWRDVAERYREIGVSSVRTAGCHGPFDLQELFPAGPNGVHPDPEGYAYPNWSRTELCLDAIVEYGMEPYIRIGYAYPPGRKGTLAPATLLSSKKERHKVADAATDIVERIVSVAGDQVTCVEIWNEPDVQLFWPYSDWLGNRNQRKQDFDEFCSLYCLISKALRDRFGNRLRIGGPGFTQNAVEGAGGGEQLDIQAADRFLDYLRDHRTSGGQLDFLSWHAYGDDPNGLPNRHKKFAACLEKSAFKRAPHHLTEWNLTQPHRSWNLTGEGAARLTGAFINMVHCKFERAFFYRGATQVGTGGQNNSSLRGTALINEHGERNPTGIAFGLWSKFWRFAGKDEGQIFEMRARKPGQKIDKAKDSRKDLLFGLGASNAQGFSALIANCSKDDLEYDLTRPSGEKIPARSVRIDVVKPNGSYHEREPEQKRFLLDACSVHRLVVSTRAIREGIRTGEG